MSTILHTWCGLSANLECRSETCCTRLAENTGRMRPVGNFLIVATGLGFAMRPWCRVSPLLILKGPTARANSMEIYTKIH